MCIRDSLPPTSPRQEPPAHRMRQLGGARGGARQWGCSLPHLAPLLPAPRACTLPGHQRRQGG
eukprot:13325034-Alexandrium_andersonii.AAC.1